MVPELLLSCLWFSLWQPSKCFPYLPSLWFKKWKQISIEDPLHKFTKDILGLHSEVLYHSHTSRTHPLPLNKLDLRQLAELAGPTGRGHSRAWLYKVAHKLVFGGSFYLQVESWPQMAVPLVPPSRNVSHRLLMPVDWSTRSQSSVVCSLTSLWVLGAVFSVWASLLALTESKSQKINTLPVVA